MTFIQPGASSGKAIRVKDGSSKRKWANDFQESMEAFRTQQKHRDKLLIAYLGLPQENSEAGIDGTLDGAAAINSPKKI